MWTLKVWRRIAFYGFWGHSFTYFGVVRVGSRDWRLDFGAEALTLGQSKGLRVLSSGFCAKLGLDFDSNSPEGFTLGFTGVYLSAKLDAH